MLYITAAVCAVLQASTDHVARRGPFNPSEPIADYERGANLPGLARLNAQIIRIWAAQTADPIGRAQAQIANASRAEPRAVPARDPWSPGVRGEVVPFTCRACEEVGRELDLRSRRTQRRRRSSAVVR